MFVPLRSETDQMGLELRKSFLRNALRISSGESIVTKRVALGEAQRCGIEPAPALTHPNGGLYLYGTETFGSMFAEIISHLLPTGGKHDLGCDECLIVNQLWQDHRSAMRFLPADYNVNLHQNESWVSNPVMQSYVYHFVARAKERLPEVRWQRTDPLELPYPWDKRSRDLVENWGDDPPASYTLESTVHVETAINLLTAYPTLQIIIPCSTEAIPVACESIKNHDRCKQFSATQTSYLNLLRLMLRVGPNATRVVVHGPFEQSFQNKELRRGRAKITIK